MIPLVVLGGVAWAGYRAYQRLVADERPLGDAGSPAAAPGSAAASTTGKPPMTLRSAQLQEILTNTTDRERREWEAENRHFLKLSFVNSGLATAALLLAPAYTVYSVPLTLYTSLPVFRDAWRSIREGNLRIAVLDATAITIDLAAGYYVLSAYTAIIYFAALRLLDRTRNHNRLTICNAFQELPQTVWVRRGESEVELGIADLQIGDVVVVNAGDVIPVDGRVVVGIGSVDQRMLTGETQQVEIGVGDPVMAATVLLAGRIEVATEKAGSETLAVHITQVLNQTDAYELALLTRTEDVVNRTVAPMLGLGAFTFLTLGPASTLAVMGANYAEVLRVTGPISMINFLELASSQAILVKDARTLEILDRIDTVVFDKTGTLTLDQPHVGAIHLLNGEEEERLLRLAAAAEQYQRHPIARAIVDAARERGLELPPLYDGNYEVGYGLQVTVDGQLVQVGSRRFMEMSGVGIDQQASLIETVAHDQGHSVVLVAIDGRLAGLVELRPTVRPEVYEEIVRLRRRGLELHILSGDHEAPTRHLARELGIDHYHANTLPDAKARLIDQLQEAGRSVCYVGDGINDAIALKRAAVSISLRGASSIATDTAQVLFMDQRLDHLDQLFDLAREFRQNQRGGILSTVVPGVVAVGGIYLFHFGILSTMLLFNFSLLAGLGVAAMPHIKRTRGLPAPLQSAPRVDG